MSLIPRPATSSIGIAAACLLMLLCTSCKYWKGGWVNATIVNQTGQPIHQLEVDYPSASFGTNTVAPGAAMHYRFQISGKGPVKVIYLSADGKAAHATGPALSEGQQGQLTVRLLPLGKVEFVPTLQPAA